MNDDGFIPGVFLASMVWILILLAAVKGVDDSWRSQIEAHGCAGYYLDSNRDKQWNWKP